jgi:hypothetical protein
LSSFIACQGSDAATDGGLEDGQSNIDNDSGLDGSDNTEGQSTDGDQGGDQVSTKCYEDIDIVFVLDVSTSMDYILSTLEAEIGQVWQTAKDLDSNVHFGLVVFVDDSTVVSTSYSSVEDLQNDFHTWYTHTATNMQTQSPSQNYDWPENSLDALAAAVEEFPWRLSHTTLRVIIHVTDDTFLEHPDSFTSGIQVQHTYAEVLSALVDNDIHTACFAAHLGGQFGDIDVGAGFFTDYQEHQAIPQATASEVFDIDEVYAGDISLTESINDFVVQLFCYPL